jgi:hypothetical protein
MGLLLIILYAPPGLLSLVSAGAVSRWIAARFSVSWHSQRMLLIGGAGFVLHPY